MKIAPKRLITAGGTLVCALGIGFFMQNSAQAPATSAAPSAAKLATASVAGGAANPATEAPVAPSAPDHGSTAESNPPEFELDDIVLTSAAPVKPEMPALPASSVTPAAFEEPDTATVEDDTAAAMAPVCEHILTATPDAAAMVRLTLTSPCMLNERFILHHNGLMITEVTGDDGAVEFMVPALAQNAVFIVAFTNGEGAVATIEVPALDQYERAVLQWRGESGMQIHAREYGADYDSDGHVWAESARDITAVSTGTGGFMTRHGAVDLDDALLAEVYTFPIGVIGREGDVILTVETEVTQANCGRDVEAQSIQKDAAGNLKTHDLVLAVPECNAVGDFLVLKNLLNDLKIAAN